MENINFVKRKDTGGHSTLKEGSKGENTFGVPLLGTEGALNLGFP